MNEPILIDTEAKLLKHFGQPPDYTREDVADAWSLAMSVLQGVTLDTEMSPNPEYWAKLVAKPKSQMRSIDDEWDI